jgi:aquaporin NIP
MEPGSTPPNGSAPATPGTPAPLFSGGGSRVDSLSYERKSMPRCKCLPLPAVEGWGVATHTCVVEIPAPDVSLTRKVRHRHRPVHMRVHMHARISFCSFFLPS